MIDRILVTGANGDIGHAAGRILAECSSNTVLIGTDVARTGQWPGLEFFAEMETLPSAASADYVQELTRIAGLKKVSLVIPTSEPELRALSLGCSEKLRDQCLMNCPEVILRLTDKLETSLWLSAMGVPVPRTVPLNEARVNDLPLVVKPRFGRGSRGLEFVRSLGRLSLVQSERDEPCIAQEEVGTLDSEYTCVVLKCAGVVRTLIMRRQLIGGMTSRIVVENDSSIEGILRTIADHVPEGTNINVQLRREGNRLCVFEINPRLSGTLMMRHRLGFRDLMWWIASRSGVAPPEFVVPTGAQVFRTFGEVVVDPRV